MRCEDTESNQFNCKNEVHYRYIAKEKSLVTIPIKVMKKLQLTVGDKLDVSEQGGKTIIPQLLSPKTKWFFG